jgi:Tfp pilus assembly protein FimT
MSPRQSDSKEPRRGFTRIELLVILATLALLAAVTLGRVAALR